MSKYSKDKTEKIQIRCSAEELDRWTEAMRLKGKSNLSEFIREATNYMAGNKSKA